ncbi:MAG: serine--tRNA ligase [Patescibacteria group bacterium]|jgi:seryl-tRNA synthetase
MIDPKFIKENKAKVLANNKSRGVSVDLDKLLRLYDQRNEQQAEIEQKRNTRNKNSKTKPTPEIIEQMKTLGEELNNLEMNIRVTEDELNNLLYQLPNMNWTDTPIGASDQDNKIIKTVGEMPEFDFMALDHSELGLRLDLIDAEKGTALSGNRFWYLKNELVDLEMALIHFAWKKMRQAGFSPMAVPHLVRERAMFGTGFFPAEMNEVYKVNPGEDDLFLIGTAEVPLINYHADEVLDLSKAKKYFAFTPAYRREAGSYGQDTKGILRGHQFDKIEMVIFCEPAQSESMHQEILSLEESIYQALELPYHVVNICTGDLGAVAAKKYDLEAWMPGQNKYREITSCTNATDYQSRRLNIKYIKDGKKELCHTLNGTVIALGRVMIAIMENYQTKDGSIRMPKVLHEYLDFKEIKK